MKSMIDYKKLIEEAYAARDMAYVPYSGFRVGAALLGKNGKIFRGCNIENASYTPTNCAERTAVFKAVSEGQKEFTAIAIVGGYDGREESEYCSPCGVCRQVLREFCDPAEFQVILAKGREDYKVFTLEELLPMGFGPENIKRIQ